MRRVRKPLHPSPWGRRSQGSSQPSSQPPPPFIHPPNTPRFLPSLAQQTEAAKVLTPRSWFARKLSDEHPLDRNELQSKHTVRGAEERVVWGGEGRGGGGKVWRPPVSGVSVGLCVWRLAGNAHCGLPTMRRQGDRDSWLGSAECTSRSTRAAVTEAAGAVCGAAMCGVPGQGGKSTHSHQTNSLH